HFLTTEIRPHQQPEHSGPTSTRSINGSCCSTVYSVRTGGNPPDRWTCTFYCESFRLRILSQLSATVSWALVDVSDLGSFGRRPVRTRRRIAGFGVFATRQRNPLFGRRRLLRRRKVT